MMQRIMFIICLFALVTACAQRPNKDAFLTALSTGDLDTIRAQIRGGMDPDSLLNADGDTALHLSVRDGNRALTDLLIERGANPFRHNLKGTTPIDLALNFPNTASDAAWHQWALDRANAGLSAYEEAIEAITRSDPERLRYLLQTESFYRYPIPPRNRYRTAQPDPLTITAVQANCLSCLTTLLDNGYDPNRANVSQQTPLNIAVRFKNHGMIDLLIKAGADTNLQDNDGWTPLMLSIVQGEADLVRRLLQAGADPNLSLTRPAWAKTTALHLVASELTIEGDHKKSDVAEWLIQAGAQVNAQDNQRATPLHLAATNGFHTLIGTLLRHGAKVNWPDQKGVTPLMRAVMSGHPESVEALLDAGADPERATYKGWTALHLVAGSAHAGTEADRIKQAEQLIRRGARVNARTLTQVSPLILAISNTFPRLADMLLRHGADPNQPEAAQWTPLMYAVRAGDLATTRRLLMSGARVNTADLIGWTPLHVSANLHSEGGDAVQAALTRLLIAAGADVNARNTEDVTPLHFAAAYGRLETGRVLLEHGASRTQRTVFGQTPADLARIANHPALLDLLASPEPGS